MASSARLLDFFDRGEARERQQLADQDDEQRQRRDRGQPAASQPSHRRARTGRGSAGRSTGRPPATTSAPSAPRKMAPSRERRRGAIAGGGSLVSTMSGPSKTSISAGIDDRDVAISASARGFRAARLGASRLAAPASPRARGSMRNAAGLRGSRHASLSPIRNCSARSSRICGSDSVTPSARALELRRPEAHEADRGLAAASCADPAVQILEHESGFLRQVAGKYGGFGLAVERLLADRLAARAACR